MQANLQLSVTSSAEVRQWLTHYIQLPSLSNFILHPLTSQQKVILESSWGVAQASKHYTAALAYNKFLCGSKVDALHRSMSLTVC